MFKENCVQLHICCTVCVVIEGVCIFLEWLRLRLCPAIEWHKLLCRCTVVVQRLKDVHVISSLL